MKFTQLRPEGGDCTAPYGVTEFPEIVADFVGEVLGKYKREWGYIVIKRYRFEYRFGKLLNNISSELLVRSISHVEASGGWTRMDYHLTLKSTNS